MLIAKVRDQAHAQAGRLEIRDQLCRMAWVQLVYGFELQDNLAIYHDIGSIFVHYVVFVLDIEIYLASNRNPSQLQLPSTRSLLSLLAEPRPPALFTSI